MSGGSVAATAAERPEPPFPSAALDDALKLLVKAMRAHQLYLHNNPTYLRALEAARGGFTQLWAHTDEVTLRVTETAFDWEGVLLLADAEKSGDSLAWLCYKDGVRDLRLKQGFEGPELVAFLDIVRRVRKAVAEEDDLLTMLWEQDFEFLQYTYVDLAAEAVRAVDGDVVRPAPTHVSPQAVQDEVAAPPRAGVVTMEDFNATLYFLEEREIEYVRGEVAREYEQDLRQNVLNVLFDVFEAQQAPATREEVCAILDSLLLLFLAGGRFRSVTALLAEAARVAALPDVAPELQRRLATLPERVSDPAALAQLLQALDDALELPPAEELAAFFAQLRPIALGPVLGGLARGGSRLRPHLEAAADRLAGANVSELVRLIGDRDRGVALEAARRAGALRTPGAVGALTRMLADSEPVARAAAVQALADIGSAGAMQSVERVIDDADREVRIAASRALAARQHRAALPKLEAVVKGKAIREADLTEKMAVFEAYGALAGNGGVALLDALLNGRTFLGRREDAELRACAAVALGRVGTPPAADALRKAADDKEVLVRNAVNRAARQGQG